MANGAHEANDTVEAKEAGKAIVAAEAHEANETGGAKVAKANFPNETDKAKANDADKAKTYEVNEAIVVDAANEANVIAEIIVANIKH